MPSRAARCCLRCGQPSRGARGDGCRQPRKSIAKRGYGRSWRRARREYLAEHPLCAECDRDGRTTEATIVDHVIPHRGDPELFWDRTNWQSLCKPHHDAKTGEGG